MVGLNRSGKLSWNLLVVLVLALLVLVSLLIFSNFLRDKIVEAFQVLVDTVFGG